MMSRGAGFSNCSHHAGSDVYTCSMMFMTRREGEMLAVPMQVVCSGDGMIRMRRRSRLRSQAPI